MDLFGKLNELGGLLAGFNASWIVAMGAKYGILREISKHESGITQNELNDRYRNASVLDTWLKGAYAFGIVDRKDGRFL